MYKKLKYQDWLFEGTQNKPGKSTTGCAGLAVLFLHVKFRFSKKATNNLFTK